MYLSIFVSSKSPNYEKVTTIKCYPTKCYRFFTADIGELNQLHGTPIGKQRANQFPMRFGYEYNVENRN